MVSSVDCSHVYMYMYMYMYMYWGSPKFTKLCSHLLKMLLPLATNIKENYTGNKAKIGYSIQGLVVKVKDTVLIWLVHREPL